MIQSRILTVIPVFNRGHMATQALATVLAQTQAPDLICVVNDGSTDETRVLLSNFIEEHPDAGIVLENIPRGGAAQARNYALTKYGHSFDAVVFLDSDDLWPVDFLARTSKALFDNPKAIACSASRVVLSVDINSRKYRSLAGMRQNPWLWLMRNGGGIGSCTLFRTAGITKAGLYPTDYPTGHDVVLFSKLAGTGPWLHVEGEPVTFRTNFEKTHPEAATHINQTVADKCYMWARAHHVLFQATPHHLRYNRRFRRRLSHRWRLAALQRFHNGYAGTKVWECVVKGLRVYPFDHKLYFVALRLLLKIPIDISSPVEY